MSKNNILHAKGGIRTSDSSTEQSEVV